MKNKNEPKTGLLAFSKDNSIQYHFIKVMRCIFLVFKLKNSSQKPLKDKLQILHLNFKFKVTSTFYAWVTFFKKKWPSLYYSA